MQILQIKYIKPIRLESLINRPLQRFRQAQCQHQSQTPFLASWAHPKTCFINQAVFIYTESCWGHNLCHSLCCHFNITTCRFSSFLLIGCHFKKAVNLIHPIPKELVQQLISSQIFSPFWHHLNQYELYLDCQSFPSLPISIK